MKAINTLLCGMVGLIQAADYTTVEGGPYWSINSMKDPVTADTVYSYDVTIPNTAYLALVFKGSLQDADIILITATGNGFVNDLNSNSD